ncbi:MULTISPECIES: alkene reductase [Rhodomicrobium]|uniref:alkene reductase n=1 Tax=Rhodomicrobium TaxID=1068 RepID=UPI000B4C1CEE|nr:MULTISPECIES: alkene reductase [Rhodomicrobium]
MSILFEPIVAGEFRLPNRIVMAPLTRSRAGDARLPNALMAQYYAQRADAGLILTEATSVSPMGVGYAGTPGIWSKEQVEGWKLVTGAVHARGGRIALQLWHVGRISHPTFLNGEPPVAPSAIAANGHVSLLRPEQPYPVPRALEIGEIPGIVEAFRRGAENAMEAGFDGVEIHGANGYLLDQFLQDISNHREDGYGGPVENRARLMLEVADAVISVWGAGRVGMHLAPRGDSHSMGDSNRPDTFTHVATELGKRKLAFICAREHLADDSLGARLKSAFGGVYIVNERFKKDAAEALIASGKADAVAFGKAFIANPDLVRRLREDAPLNEWDSATFYTGGEKGYVDYPALT